MQIASPAIASAAQTTLCACANGVQVIIVDACANKNMLA